MALMRFSPYEPDVADLDTDVGNFVQNVFPRADGYGPAPGFVTYASALPAACRGYFYARNSDGSIAVFAGTATRLYKLNNTTLEWIDVSLGATDYASLVSTDMWRFAQFQNNVVAVQVGVAPQVFDLTSSTAFANLGGSPPNAGHVSVINQFLILTGISGSPYRIQWSGLGSITTWDNVSLQSNFVDMADGGLTHEVAGTDTYGILFQDSTIRLLIFSPGAPFAFFIQRLAQDDGVYAQYSVVRAGDDVFFISPQGFKRIPAGGSPTFIGKERVDRTFFANVDTGNLQLVLGVVDPTSTRVYWAYKSLAGQAGLFDTVILYDRALDKWSQFLASGEFIAPLSKPGVTLEGLDAIASGTITVSSATNNGSGLIRLALSSTTVSWTYPNGTVTSNSLSNMNTVEVYGVNGTTEANGNWQFNVVDSTHIDLKNSTFTNAYTSGGAIGGTLDALTFSLDSISNATQAQLSMVNSSHQLGFFSGQNLAAIVDTTETDLGGQRMMINGLRLFTDASSATCSIFARDNPQATASQTSATSLNSLGVCPQRIETRYAKARLQIPPGATWTYALGVEPYDSQPAGER